MSEAENHTERLMMLDNEIQEAMRRHGFAGIAFISDDKCGAVVYSNPDWSPLEINDDGTANINFNSDNADNIFAIVNSLRFFKKMMPQVQGVVESVLKQIDDFLDGKTDQDVMVEDQTHSEPQ